MSESHLVRKLRHGAQLASRDVERLEALVRSANSVEAGTDLIVEEASPRHLHIVTSGVACRYKHLPDGRRAILALLLPGDFCDLHVSILGHMDHSIGTLVDSRISRVSEDRLEELLNASVPIRRACWWATLVDEAILREWLVNVGRRPSNQQIPHLFCEIYTRLCAVGMARDHGFDMPLTQAMIADLLGISAVHVQRVLRELRDEGLVTLQGRRVTFPNYDRTAAHAQFDPGYLHLGNARTH